MPVGGEFQVNAYAGGDQGDPDIASFFEDKFVVTGTSAGQEGSVRVFLAGVLC